MFYKGALNTKAKLQKISIKKAVSIYLPILPWNLLKLLDAIKYNAMQYETDNAIYTNIFFLITNLSQKNLHFVYIKLSALLYIKKKLYS